MNDYGPTHASRAATAMVSCRNGNFELPGDIVSALESRGRRQFVYVREDQEMLTIAPAPIEGGRRRQLRTWFRFNLFRDATALAVVDMRDSVRVMAVEWRRGSRRQAK